MNERLTGWLWVVGQGVLLLALLVLPGNDHWPTPSIVEAVAAVWFFGGLILIAAAALGLGRALTPTPVPRNEGALNTSGFYRYVRHPIYTGVLAVVVGITLRSGSWIHLAIAVLTVVFFDRKAAWEEQRLAEHYADYATYAAATPKFVPQPWR